MKHKVIVTYVNTVGGRSRWVRTGTFAECVDQLAQLDRDVGDTLDITDVVIRPLRPDEATS